MNINKVFPRLSLRAKLAIAFAILALAPLALVAAVTTRITITRLRAAAGSALQREVRTAAAEVTRALDQVDRDVEFLADALAANQVLSQPLPDGDLTRTVAAFLDHAPYLFRVKAITPDGMVAFAASAATEPAGPDSPGLYYAWRAQSLPPGRRMLLPVEVKSIDAVSGDPRTLPVVAVLVPVFDGGEFRGAIVGEAYAATLLSSLERVAAAYPSTTTSLLDREEHYLYHSTRKRDWDNLLAADTGPGAAGPALRAAAAAGRGLARTTELLVAGEAIPLGNFPGADSLSLVRAVRIRDVDEPVREFLGWLSASGAGLLLGVLGVSLVAARQLTSPIYSLRDAARLLSGGGAPAPVAIETNDELEDFASDFNRMAAALQQQRRRLEATVSERTRELDRTHAELSDVLDRSADAIIGLDPAGRIRIWNRGAATLFGWEPEEVIGEDADALLRGGGGFDAEADFVRREVAEKGAAVDLPTLRRTRTGRMVPVSVTQTPLHDGEGNLLGTSLIFRDISVQQQLEQHMRRSERLAAMSVMAAGLAHELNNPLAIIGNRIECMEAELEALDQPGLVADLGVLRGHATRLTTLTQDLLRFAREPNERLEPVEVRSVAHRVADLLERTLAGRNIRIAVRAPAPATVFGAEHAIETVILNLVLNAADAMPSGGRIGIDMPPGDEVRLTVADEGPGVPDDLKERVFEAFFTTKGTRGTGLGLSLCRSIVERHAGRIWVEDGQPRGARFVLALPRFEESA
ncbi:MAG: ATP-binding protein [Gemmatimonadales bacterium]